MPGPFQAVYNASKSFVQSFALALHNELKDTGVSVTSLMPGPGSAILRCIPALTLSGSTRLLALAASVRRDIDEMPGLTVLDRELVNAQASSDLDRLQILIDVSELGISGYQAADWLRANRRIDVGLSDHRRILATLSLGDDEETAARLLEALEGLRTDAAELTAPHVVELPEPEELELEMACSPRDAFFGNVEQVPTHTAVGRIVAEQITPYPQASR
jgi:lysine decarboxylase